MIQQGDRVVCVNKGKNRESRLVVGRQYTVYGIDRCCDDYLDVGIVSPTGNNMCAGCGKRTTDGVWWCLHSLFRKVEERTVEKVIEYTAEIKIDIPEPILS